jgi:hypothetical protein
MRARRWRSLFIARDALGLVMAPVIGMFNAMMPASLIGMYGGMFFGMRDSMAAGSRTLQAAIVVGAILGAIVVAGVKYYDQILAEPLLIRRVIRLTWRPSIGY